MEQGEQVLGAEEQFQRKTTYAQVGSCCADGQVLLTVETYKRNVVVGDVCRYRMILEPLCACKHIALLYYQAWALYGTLILCLAALYMYVRPPSGQCVRYRLR